MSGLDLLRATLIPCPECRGELVIETEGPEEYPAIRNGLQQPEITPTIRCLACGVLYVPSIILHKRLTHVTVKCSFSGDEPKEPPKC